MYNTTTHLCCAQNNILPIKTTATKCCGSGVFESDSETCCEMANRGFPGVGGRCCHRGSGEVVAYDPSQASCCSWRQYGENLTPLCFSKISLKTSVYLCKIYLQQIQYIPDIYCTYWHIKPILRGSMFRTLSQN